MQPDSNAGNPVVTEIIDDNGDKTVRTYPTNLKESGFDFSADGMPAISYLEVDIQDDTVLKSVSFTYRKSNTAYQWAGIRYTDDGGTTWKFLAEFYDTASKLTDFSHSWSGNLNGVDSIRICVWANGGSNPGYMYIDDIVVEQHGPQIINQPVAENNPLVDLFYNGSDAYQAVYSFNINASNEADFYSLKDFTLNDNGSTALAADITDFKVYYGGATNVLSPTTAELTTSATITPATLGNITLTTPQKIFDGDNWIIIAAKRKNTPTIGNEIKLHVPSMTLNSGVDVVKTISSSTATVSVVASQPERGLYLDGSGYVDFTRHNEWKQLGQFTFEARIKPTDLSNQKTVIGGDSNGSYFGLRLAINSDGSILYGFKSSQSSNGANNWVKTSSPSLISVDTWYHISVTYDADGSDNDIILYLNGMEVDRYEVDDAVTNGNVWDKPFRYIGHDYYGNDFVGEIDEVRLWDYSRSGNDINFTKTSHFTGTETGLVAFFNLDQLINNIVSDTSTLNLARDPQFFGTIINPLQLSVHSVITNPGSLDPIKVFTAPVDLKIAPNSVTTGNLVEYATFIDVATYYYRITTPVTGVTVNTDGTYQFNPQLNPASTVTFDYEVVEGTPTSRANGDVIGDGSVTLTRGAFDYNWKFDGDLIDDISAEVGTVPGGATYDESNSVYGFGLTLNGTDYMTTNVNLGSGNIQYTLSAWIFPTTDPSEPTRIFSDYNNNLGVLLEPGDNNIRVYYGGNLETVSARLDLFDWHLVTVTHDDKTLRIYQDGVEVASAPVVHDYGSNGELRIGANHDATPGQQFYGTIDDVQVYSYALSANAVMSEYTKGTPVTGLEMTQTGNLLEWKVDSEYNVNEYQVVNIATGELIATIPAGQGPYSLTLEPGIEAKLIVVDHSGFKQTFFPENGNSIVYNYPLTEGWNLITLPTNKAELSNLRKATVGDFWAWTGSSYRTANDEDQTVWVYAETSKEVTVRAEKESSVVTLQQGWNLVGSLENIEAPSNAELIYSWNNKYQQIADENAILLQGVGYWIFSF